MGRRRHGGQPGIRGGERRRVGRRARGPRHAVARPTVGSRRRRCPDRLSATAAPRPRATARCGSRRYRDHPRDCRGLHAHPGPVVPCDRRDQGAGEGRRDAIDSPRVAHPGTRTRRSRRLRRRRTGASTASTGARRTDRAPRRPQLNRAAADRCGPRHRDRTTGRRGHRDPGGRPEGRPQQQGGLRQHAEPRALRPARRAARAPRCAAPVRPDRRGGGRPPRAGRRRAAHRPDAQR